MSLRCCERFLILGCHSIPSWYSLVSLDDAAWRQLLGKGRDFHGIVKHVKIQNVWMGYLSETSGRFSVISAALPSLTLLMSDHDAIVF